MKIKILITVLIAFATMISSCRSSRQSVRGSEALLRIENESFSVKDNRAKGLLQEREKINFGKEETPQNKSEKELRKALIEYAKEWLGTPYMRAGNSKRGSDCSGLTSQTYYNVANVKLPRSSSDQAKFCKKIDRDDLKPGDLVFFKTRGSRISHVALYIGNNEIIHSTSSRGVIISDLDEKYWKKHFHHCGRVSKVFP